MGGEDDAAALCLFGQRTASFRILHFVKHDIGRSQPLFLGREGPSFFAVSSISGQNQDSYVLGISISGPDLFLAPPEEWSFCRGRAVANAASLRRRFWRPSIVQKLSPSLSYVRLRMPSPHT